MWMCTYTCSSQYRDVGQAKELKKTGRAANTARHLGHAHHGFVSPSPVDDSADIRNLNLPNANHNTWFQVNPSVQWHLLVVSYRRFVIAYQPNFQWSSRTKPLNMGPIGCPETSVTHCQSTVRNIPVDSRPQITIVVASFIFFGISKTHKRTLGTETRNSNTWPHIWSDPRRPTPLWPAARI
jgi:hypothetical protein